MLTGELATNQFDGKEGEKMRLNGKLARLGQSLKQQINGGLLHILSGNLLVKGIGVIASILVVRLVDKTEYAYYSYANNLYGYINLLNGLGLSTALLKFCARDNTPEKDKAYYRFALTRGSWFQLLFALILCVGVYLFPIPFPQARPFVLAMAFLPLLSYIQSTAQIYHRAHGKNKRYAYIGILQAAVVCIAGVSLAWVFGTIGMVAAQYIALSVTILVGYRFVRSRQRGITAQRLGADEKKKFWAMALSLMVANLFSAMMPLNETYLVNNLIQDEVITANFRVAGVIPGLLILLTSSLMVYYFPIVARMKEPQQTLKTVVRIGLLTFGGIAICATIGAFLSPIIIKILFGNKYLDAIPIMNILWVMRAINAGVRMVPMNLLPAMGYTRFNAISAIVSCIIQTGLDYFLILNMGIYGVAYASILVYILSGAASWGYLIYVCKKGRRAEI